MTLYGTIWIILIAYFASFFAVSLKPVVGAYRHEGVRYALNVLLGDGQSLRAFPGDPVRLVVTSAWRLLAD